MNGELNRGLKYMEEHLMTNLGNCRMTTTLIDYWMQGCEMSQLEVFSLEFMDCVNDVVFGNFGVVL